MGGSLFEIINTSNIFIVKCYKYIFRYIDDSFCAIISLILLVLNICLTIFFYVVELNKIKIYVFSLTENYIKYLFKSKNTPPKKKNQRKSQKETDKKNDKDTISIKGYNSESNVIIYNKKSQTLKPINICINNFFIIIDICNNIIIF
jgi:FlaA1/EpsC-like NDP-sugar epimerase